MTPTHPNRLSELMQLMPSPIWWPESQFAEMNKTGYAQWPISSRRVVRDDGNEYAVTKVPNEAYDKYVVKDGIIWHNRMLHTDSIFPANHWYLVTALNVHHLNRDNAPWMLCFHDELFLLESNGYKIPQGYFWENGGGLIKDTANTYQEACDKASAMYEAFKELYIRRYILCDMDTINFELFRKAQNNR